MRKVFFCFLFYFLFMPRTRKIILEKKESHQVAPTLTIDKHFGYLNQSIPNMTVFR